MSNFTAKIITGFNVMSHL